MYLPWSLEKKQLQNIGLIAEFSDKQQKAL